MIKKKILLNFEQPIQLLKWKNVHTVCEESKCPNRYECSQAGIATYLIGGDTCTRSCKFCHIATGKPTQSMDDLMDLELNDIVTSAIQEKHKYIVITSVARDDDELKLAQHFANITNRLNELGVQVELLIPDFHLNATYLNIIGDSSPLVVAHNIETIERLSKYIRPQAEYKRSLNLYKHFRDRYPKMLLKAGLMIGLGETYDEIYQVLVDLKQQDVDIITIGQYMQPSGQQTKVEKYWDESIFKKLENVCETLNFSGYEIGHYVRSSYMASRVIEKALARRQ